MISYENGKGCLPEEEITNSEKTDVVENEKEKYEKTEGTNPEMKDVSEIEKESIKGESRTTSQTNSCDSE